MDGSLLANEFRTIRQIADLLRDAHLQNQLSLPKIIVMGTQSSGKSSLIEQIVGLDFLPRGSGVVTRRPLEIRLNNAPSLTEPYAEFDQIIENGGKKKFTNFSEVKEAITAVTEKVCGIYYDFLDKSIILNVFSKSCPNITIVDLPGITSISIGNAVADIYQQTKNMALRYISEPRSIIVCVLSANEDIAVNHGLKLMKEIDPTGQRSIGCLTKIDIMYRGENARSILKNQQIPLRFGYVGIKNRSQLDIVNNVTVEQGLKAERRFFTSSSSYHTLPSELWGTEALTAKIAAVLCQQIKPQMLGILNQIKERKKTGLKFLKSLNLGSINTEAEMINYSCNCVATFLKFFKGSLQGIKIAEQGKDPLIVAVGQELNSLYKDQQDCATTESITDKDIQLALLNYPGIPGFPSIDAFLSLIDPLLNKLQSPAYEINNTIYEAIKAQALNAISLSFSTSYPRFIERFEEIVVKIFDKYKKDLQAYLQQLLDSELSYIFTNDVASFERPASQGQNHKIYHNPLVDEIRTKINVYFKLVVRNLRKIIPSQILNFWAFKCINQLEFEAFQLARDIDKLKQWFKESVEVEERRTECIKDIKVFDTLERIIQLQLQKINRTSLKYPPLQSYPVVQRSPIVKNVQEQVKAMAKVNSGQSSTIEDEKTKQREMKKKKFNKLFGLQ